MPNWCWNQLRIIGPTENIKDILEHNLSFQHYVPCESDCDTQSEAWGTKWEHQDYRVLDQGEFDMKVEFRTAWAPPISFLEKLNRQFPQCWFKLEFEESMGIGSGIWIHSLTKKGNPVERVFQWQEPPCYPMSDGTFLLPDEDEEPTEEEWNRIEAERAAEAAKAVEAVEAVETVKAAKTVEVVEAPKKPVKVVKKPIVS
jgi:hypothetical protein